MMFACANNHVDAITSLFDHGADLMMRNRNHMCAMHYAATSDRLEAMDLCVSLNAARKARLLAQAATAAENSVRTLEVNICPLRHSYFA